MRVRAHTTKLETPPARHRHVDRATVGADFSQANVHRLLGRTIIGWLTIIVVIELAVKYFEWS